MRVRKFLEEYGRLYSEELGIDAFREPFKWFLASLLFGARISTNIAKKTYLEFERHGVVTPAAIQQAGWDELVRILDSGGYVRYDFKTATKLLEIAKEVTDKYDGKIEILNETSSSPRELEKRLLQFKGVGVTTVSIFLRELVGLWQNANPPLTRLELKAMRELGIGNTLEDLERFWERNKVQGYGFRNLRTGLVRFSLSRRNRSYNSQ